MSLLGNTSRIYIKRLLHLRKISSYTFLCLLVPLLWFIFQHKVNSNKPLCVLCTTKRSRLNYVATSVGQNQTSELLILVFKKNKPEQLFCSKLKTEAVYIGQNNIKRCLLLLKPNTEDVYFGQNQILKLRTVLTTVTFIF